MSFYLKRPGNAGRATYSLVERKKKEGGKGYTYKVITDNAELKAINAVLGKVNGGDLDARASALVAKLNKEQRGVVCSNEENRALVERYWKEEYEKRKIIGRESARNRLHQAVGCLGPVSLLASAGEVQRRLDGGFSSRPRVHKRLAGVLNQIRRYFGATGRIHGEKDVLPVFCHLTREEFARVHQLVRDEKLRLLFSVLFHTGLRTGEAMLLLPRHVRFPVINVTGQVDRSGVSRATKTGKNRKAVCLPGGEKDLAAWVSLADKDSYCRNSLSRVFKAACRRAFPRDPTKHCTVHDLRHSYAVHMLTVEGHSMTLVARLLGNSEYVCERYYANFVFEDDLLNAIINKRRAV